MNRATSILIGVGAGVFVVVFVGGGGGPLVLVGALAALVVWSAAGALRRRRPSVEAAWSSPPGPFTFVRAAPRTGGPGGVTAALGRVESRQLLGSAALWAGFAFGLTSVWLFGWVWASDNGGEIARIAEMIPWLVHPLAGLTIVAAHRARTRARRDGLTELFASCPVSDHERDRAHLATAWLPAVAALAIGVAVLVAYRLRVDVVWGPFGARQISHVLGGALLAVGATVLGVLLARWSPWSITPVVAVVAIGMVSLSLPGWGGDDADGIAQLATAPTIEGFDWLDVRFTAPQWLAHHAWIAALVVLVVAVTLWSGSRTRPHTGLLVAAVALVAVGGWAATRSTADSDVDRIVSMILEPERHQECVDLGVSFCTYEGDGVLADAYAPHIADVLGPVPPGLAVTGVAFRQGADVRVDALDDAIADGVRGWRPEPGVVPMKLSTEGFDAARYWVALAAAGIVDETSPGTVVDLAGQARGVVAIWLATRGVPEDRAIEEMASLPPATDHGEEWYGARPWPDVCLAGPTPVQWSHSDLDAARQLIRAPQDDVSAVLHDRWDHWLDPATRTDELLVALGRPELGESAGRTPVSVSC